jgi:XTP/dITP diphosphohydrolase
MKAVDIRFISWNEYKLEEFLQLMNERGYSIQTLKKKIFEIQTENIQDLIEDKAVQAFTAIGRPLVIEHTGLSLVKLNGLPAGLTQMFWDRLEGDRFASLFGSPPTNGARATTVLAYCDGFRIRTFEGAINGQICEKPRGDRHFQWDTVFVPEGYSKTFAEMGLEKNKISMRARAVDAFVKWLESSR